MPDVPTKSTPGTGINKSMQEYHKNPRKITDEQLAQLKENIQLLGDLSGIVHDLNSDEIITGNQRSKIIDINTCAIKLDKQFEEPDKQGTVAYGHVIWNGQCLNYRQVRWTEEQRERACITANKLGGEFDYDMLESSFDTGDLTEWGFNEDEFASFDILGNLVEEETFSNYVKTDRDEFSMTFLIPKAYKYKLEVFLREHTKKWIANHIVEFIKTLDNERVS